MEARAARFNVTVDPERAAKLAALAQRYHLAPGSLARSLLSQAIDDADLSGRYVTDLLRRIPGAFEDVRRGHEQALRGETIDLETL